MEMIPTSDRWRVIQEEERDTDYGELGVDPEQAAAHTTMPTAELLHCAISWKKLLKYLDFFVNDILVILFSFSDIILDVLVCLTFYRDGQMIFFYISVAIFIVAQLTYGFLFVATWGKHLPPITQIAVFVAVIPVSQFVPIFTWIESFRFENLDALIAGIGLKPTADPLAAEEEDPEGDMLWGYIQHKYQSHAGFLAEALAEAIPQCMLQTIAIITIGQANPLFVVSILTSIVVIASKGYLISYSIHRVTFLFNFICIVADVFGLFAILAWVFENGGASNSLYTIVYASLLVLGWALLVTGGLCLVVFSMLDDHLKIRHFPHPYEDQDGDLWYHLYIVRTVAWFISVIPVCIVFLTTKLTLIPILVFKSLDPEHAQRWQFYSMLYRFLSLHKTDVRVVVANRFFAQCECDKPRLVHDLDSYSVNRWPDGRLRSRPDRIDAEREALQRWLQRVGKFTTPFAGSITAATAAAPVTAEPTVDHSAVAAAIDTAENEAQARARLRRALVQQEIEARLGGTRRELAKRSALFRIYYYEHEELTHSFRAVDKLIMGVGIAFMVVGLFCMALFAPVFLLCVLYAVLFPIIQLCVHAHSASALAVVLSAVYVSLLGVLCALAPLVYSFQSLRVDIIDIKNFPGIFYEKSTLQELHRRFMNELDNRAVERYMDAKFGRDMLFEIKSYLE